MPEKPYRQDVNASIAVIERRGRLLICRRKAEDVLGGCWEFPGGKCEPDESWTQCLRRELREELGIEVKAVAPFGHMRARRVNGNGSIQFKVYRCTIAKGAPRPLAAEALRWVSPAELVAADFPPANRRLIAKLKAIARQAALNSITR